MPAHPPRGQSYAEIATILALSGAAMGVRLLPQALVERHLWFLYAFTQIPWPAVILLCGLSLFLSSVFLSDRSPGEPDGAILGTGKGQLFFWAGCASLLFFVLRDRDYLIGDAPHVHTLIKVLHFEYASHSPLWNRIVRAMVGTAHPLTGVLPTTLYPALIACLSGLGLAVAWRWSQDYAELRVATLLIVTSQGIQIFFGQFEIYALSLVFEFLYVFSAWRYLRGEGSPWLPPLLVSCAVATGGWNLILLPSVAVLAYSFIRDEESVTERVTRGILFTILAVLPFALIDGLEGMFHAIQARDPTETEGLTIFTAPVDGALETWSLEHLTNLLNLALALGLPMLAWMLFGDRERLQCHAEPLPKARMNRLFLIVLVLPETLPALIWYPGYGHRVDVDLFTFCVPIWALWAGVMRPSVRFGEALSFRRIVWAFCLLPLLATITANANVWRDGWFGAAFRAAARPVTTASVVERRIQNALITPDRFRTLEEEAAADPERTAHIVGWVDTELLLDLADQEPHLRDDEGWAIDLLLKPDGGPVVLDRWGRILESRGERLEILDGYPAMSPQSRFVAFTRLDEGVFALLQSDGSVVTRDPRGWRERLRPLRLRGFPPHLRGVDIRYDETRESLLVLDNEYRLHVVDSGTVLGPVHTRTKTGRRLLPNPHLQCPWTDSWCVITTDGWFCATTQPYEPPWPSPFAHFIVADAILTAEGRGALYLDWVGGIHPVGQTPAVEVFYPLPMIGRFVRMALAPDERSLTLLDRCYRLKQLQLQPR